LPVRVRTLFVAIRQLEFLVLSLHLYILSIHNVLDLHLVLLSVLAVSVAAELRAEVSRVRECVGAMSASAVAQSG
jgi:hypothetical protein